MSSSNLKLNTAWDLSPLYSSPTDPKILQDRERVRDAISKFAAKWEPRTDYLQEPKLLCEALNEYDQLNREFGLYDQESYFLGLLGALDQQDPVIKAASSRSHDLVIKAHNDLQFFFLRLAKIDASIQDKFLNFSGLAPYRHFLEKSFAESKFLLSEAEEKILALEAKTAHSAWVNMTEEFISSSIEKGKTFEQLMPLTQSKDKKVRSSTNASINKILSKHAKVAEHEINAVLHSKKVVDLLRGLTRPDQVRHISDDIDTSVVDTLVQTVADNFSVSADWYKFRAKLLGQKTIGYHERLVDLSEAEREYSFPDAVKLVSSVFHELDSEFGSFFDQFVSHGQVDAYPKQNKSGGAFCANSGLKHPTYILLNHTGKLRDCLTLAHEAGHGINSELMRTSRNSLDFDTPKSTAEVASTFCEDFVLERLARDASPRQALDILIHKIDDDMGSIFRQVALYRFEQELHKSYREKGFLSLEFIGELFVKHMSAYCGPAVKFGIGHQNWWVYWSHIRSFFYVYSYASGLLISKSLQGSVRQDKQFMVKVKDFLRAGTSDSPKNIFSKLGIDISDPKFWEQGIAQTKANIEKAKSLATTLKLI